MGEQGFKDSVKNSDKFFGVNPKVAARAAKWNDMWQKTSFKRAALIATAVTVPVIAAFSLKSCSVNAQYDKAVVQMQESKGLRASAKKALAVGKDRTENPVYQAAARLEADRVKELNKGTTEQVNLEYVYYNVPTAHGNEAIKVEFLTHTRHKDRELNISFNVNSFDGVIDEGQRNELNAIIASMIDGPKRNKLLENAGNKPIVEFVNGLWFGSDESDPLLIRHYMTREQAERLRKFLLNLRPDQAKRMKEAMDKWIANGIKDIDSKENKSNRTIAMCIGAVMGFVCGCMGIAVVKEDNSKADPIVPSVIGGAIVGVIAGGIMTLTMHSAIGWLGLPAGIAVGLATGLLRKGIDKLS